MLALLMMFVQVLIDIVISGKRIVINTFFHSFHCKRAFRHAWDNAENNNQFSNKDSQILKSPDLLSHPRLADSSGFRRTKGKTQTLQSTPNDQIPKGIAIGLIG